MKKIFNLLCLLFFSCSFSQDWIEVPIANLYTIQFPNPPEITVSNDETLYTTTNDFGIYTVNVRQLGDKNISRIQLLDFYEDTISETVDAANGELVYTSDFLTNGIKGKEFSYLAFPNRDVPNLRYERVFVTGNIVMHYTFWTYMRLEEAAAPHRAKFFNSLNQISGAAKPERVETEPKDYYDLAFWVGKASYILLFVIIIIAFVFVSKYIAKKKKKGKI